MSDFQDMHQGLLAHHGVMKSVRAIEEPHWREIAAFLRTDDRDFDAHVQRRRDDSPIFDIEPILAMDDFEGGFFTQATNPMNRWFALSSGDDDLDEFQPAKVWLWRGTNKLLASFSTAVSAFYAEVPDAYGHTGCFGTGVMFSAEKFGEGRFIDIAVPLNECFMERDADGRTTRLHREMNLTGTMARMKFRDHPALARLKPDDRAVFVHAVFKNPDFVPGRLAVPDAFVGAYLSPDIKDFWIEDRFYEFPYHIFGWKRRSGRHYDTGIGHKIRADVVMLNDIERSNVVGLQFAAEPVMLAHEKSDVLAADIEPNKILYGTKNADGKDTFGVLDRHQAMPLALAYSQQKRDLIRRAVRFGLQQLLNRPQMTATEFLGFQEEDLKLFAPGLVRVQNEGLSTLIARRFSILLRAGLFDNDPPPPELQGRPLALKFVSPLSKMIKVSEAKGALQWVNALLPIKQANPQSTIMDNVDEDKLAVVVHDGFSSDPTLLVDPRVRDQKRAQLAAQQQAMAKMQIAEQAANVHATVSHADQAQTLAQRRVQ